MLLSFPLGIAYLVALVTGAAMTLGLSVTILGPVALVVTLLAIVALSWFDGHVTRGLLGVDVSPTFPATDDGPLAFLKVLLLGRATWFGAVYLCWKVLLGIVGFAAIVVGASLATSLLVTPFLYDQHLVVDLGSAFESIAIDTLGRALAAAALGGLATLAMLYLANLVGRTSAVIASALLDSPET